MAFTPWDNPMGTDGFEFIEYAAPNPAEVGRLFEQMGFKAVARHRHKNVTLYRQGGINFIVNAEPDSFAQRFARLHGPSICAIAFRVNDAAAAYKRALDLGAWGFDSKSGPMELNIPAIKGIGDSLLYFVDRYDEFSIFDIDFRAIPGVDPHPPAIHDMHYFGLVQYVGMDRTLDWAEFYGQILGFRPLPDTTRFGIMPKGLLLQSPCGKFCLQLIEPDGAAQFAPMEEHFQRIGLGTPDVISMARELERRGIEFLSTDKVHTSERGALTASMLGGVMFELVHTNNGK